MTGTRARLPVTPLLAVGAFAIGTDTFVVAGALPEVARDLGTSLADAVWVSTLFALTYAVVAPVLGALTGRLERRSVLVVSLTVFAIGNVASALSTGLGALLAARIVTAAGVALYVPAASASAAELHWSVTFWLLAGLGAVCAVAVAGGLRPVRLPAAPGLVARLALARDPRVLVTVLTTLAFLTGGHFALTYIGAVRAPATDGDGTTLAVLLLVFGVFAVCGSMIGGRATDRWGPTPPGGVGRRSRCRPDDSAPDPGHAGRRERGHGGLGRDGVGHLAAAAAPAVRDRTRVGAAPALPEPPRPRSSASRSAASSAAGSWRTAGPTRWTRSASSRPLSRRSAC
ncbi:MFS transporter [Streptomyces cyslabdanicus]|uniref:MFS transporter n=1 Tax=Streptomyces cyslabdanicus TaxID=1470456 RepID=UPI004043C181